MPEDERGYLIVPHDVATGADCDGCLTVMERGDLVETKSDACATVVDTVPIDRAGLRLIELGSEETLVALGVRIAERPACFADTPSSKRSSPACALALPRPSPTPCAADSARKIVEDAWDALEHNISEHGC
jgi:hypothetical protein